MTLTTPNELKLLTMPRTTLNNYKKISLYVPLGISCTFKCKDCCNIHYKNNKTYKTLTIEKLIKIYQENKLVEALVLSGLEPFDSFEQLMYLIIYFRKYSLDNIIIYSGYEHNEISKKLEKLRGYNIIIKLGRFIPNKEKIFNKDLGIHLASNNQYTIII